MQLRFKYGNELKELPRPELIEIADLINSEWGSVIYTNADLIHRRFQGGQLFIVGYIQDQPASILETMVIKNSELKIPEDASYEKLTGNGTFEWTQFNYGEYSLLVFVDITAGGKKGFGKETLNYSLDYVAANTDLKFIFSYTPDIIAVKKFHLSMGADSVGGKILNARKRYVPSRPLVSGDQPQDVIPFNYSKIIQNRRAKLISQ